MFRYAWKAYVRDIEEYQKRHDAIWPEMTEMLNEAGIHNYTIWNIGNELFAYMECSIDPMDSVRIQNASEVNRRWGEYMKDILYYAEGEDGPTELKQVFLHP